MQRTQQDWNRLQEEVQKLKKQNQELKKLLQLEINKNKQLTHPTFTREFQSFKQGQSMQKIITQSINGKSINQLKQQWAEWSNRLEASIVSKNNKIRHQTQYQQGRTNSNLSGSGRFESFHGRKSLEVFDNKGNSEQCIDIQISSPVKKQQQQHLNLIQDIFLFGPRLVDIQNSQQRKFVARHQLYFPEQQQEDYEIYGNYLFPNQLQIKHIRQKNHGVQVNKMIFKNNKKLDCNVFIFQGQQNKKSLNNKFNPLLQKSNPSHWMYALSIQFSDFVSVRNQHISSAHVNRTYSLATDQDRKSQRYTQGDIQSRDLNIGGTSKKFIPDQVNEGLFKSNFSLCIMTYFPFIRFLKDVLIQVFDSVKLRRMTKYQSCQSYKQIDIYFFIQQLKTQLSKFLNSNLKIQPILNKQYEFPINEVLIKLNLKQQNLINQIISDWGFKILKLLDKQSLLDIFCYVMMQQSICFLAEDKNILTFVILLYVVVFPLPFGYPHPCVSVVFNQQLLQTPFTAVLGINKGTKWLEENLEHLTENKQNKLIVNLNQDQVKIKWRKKPRTHKSQKLKKIFTTFYRKIQTSAIPSLFKKKIQLISRQTTKEQNQNVVQLFTQLQQYYKQQLFNHLPNNQIISLIKQSCGDNSSLNNNNANSIYHLVTEKIEKYLEESRKNKDKKDQFIDALMQKQLFRVYLDKRYDIL